MSAPTPAQIAQRRRALGITQAQLAQLVRANRVTISRYEIGDYHLPERRAEQIGATLGVLEAAYAVAREVAGRAGAQNG